MLVNGFQPTQLYLKKTIKDESTGATQQVFAGGLPIALEIATKIMAGMIANGQEPYEVKAIDLAYRLISEYNNRYTTFQAMMNRAEKEAALDDAAIEE